MATLLAEKMITNCNSSLLRQHRVNPIILCVLRGLVRPATRHSTAVEA